MKRFVSLVVATMTLGCATTALAGVISDVDGDLVPDPFDNCLSSPNGPNQGSNQVDSDLDGYGNRCDTDYDNSLTTTTADFAQYLATFGTNNLGETDHDGSGTVTTSDFAIFLGRFSVNPAGSPGNAPGPSGLSCASGTATACTP